MTEEEQIEKIKQLWQRYGNLLLSILLSFALVTFAYHWWQQRTFSISRQASDIYLQMLTSDMNQDDKGIQAMANGLVSDYKNTPYAAQAELMLARVAATNNKMDVALDHLKWVLDHSNNASIKQIARLRYAYILLSQNKLSAALSELNVVADPAFKPLIEGLRGDIYRSQLQYDKARSAYKVALGLLPKQTLTSAVVQMKLDNLVVDASSNPHGVNA